MLLHCFWREAHKEMSPSYRKETRKYFLTVQSFLRFLQGVPNSNFLACLMRSAATKRYHPPWPTVHSECTSWVSPEGSLPVSKHDAESPRSGKLGTVTKFPIAACVSPEEGLWLSGSELFLQPLSQHLYFLAAVQESTPSWCFFSYFFSSFLASF